jgi:hypothetical protein
VRWNTNNFGSTKLKRNYIRRHANKTGWMPLSQIDSSGPTVRAAIRWYLIQQWCFTKRIFSFTLYVGTVSLLLPTTITKTSQISIFAISQRLVTRSNLFLWKMSDISNGELISLSITNKSINCTFDNVTVLLLPVQTILGNYVTNFLLFCCLYSTSVAFFYVCLHLSFSFLSVNCNLNFNFCQSL